MDRFGCMWVAVVLFIGLTVVVAIVLLGMDQGNPSSAFNGPFGQQNRPNQGNNPGNPGGLASPSAGSSTVASAGPPSGPPVSGGAMPVISARDYISGSAPLTMTGAFSFDPASRHEVLDGHSDGERTDFWYGIDAYDPDGFIEIVFSSVGDEGFGLTILRHPWVATYLGEGCTWQVEVTDATVSGHISCTDLPAENEADGSSGTVDIELDFTANSP